MHRKSSQEGYIVITVALLALLILGAAALAVDIGVFYDTRTAAQQIADAAALGAAFTFVITPTLAQPQAAIDYATEIATSQEIRGVPIVAGEVNVNVDVGNRLVTVDISRTEGTYFARALNRNTADIQVRASAEASANATGSDCTKPWILPNTVLLPAGSNLCDTCPGPTFDPVLASQVLISGGAITPFAISRRGSQMLIKPQRPSTALRPGQFYAIQLGSGSGADVYRDSISACAPNGVFCDQCYSTETGNMVGPTKQGVENLIGDPADTFNANSEAFCYDPGCKDTSRGLVVVPIWDVCSTPDPVGCPNEAFCPDGKFAGANVSFRVVGFGLIFVEGVQGDDVVARLIDVKTCAGSGGGGGGGGSGGGGETGPFAVPVRLVQPPSS